MKHKPTEFIEPFAGGCIVGLNVAFKQLAGHVTLVELDESIAAVWQSIIYGNAERLVTKIVTFDLTPESAARELSKTSRGLEQKAFQTILRNRVNRGGIMASGAGMLKYGENGKGIKSRWYPETLKKRILDIVKIRERLTFAQENGLGVIERNANRSDVVFFIDPPYTVGSKQAGRRLYNCHEVDHEKLFRTASLLTGDFLMTYSNDERVHKLAQEYSFDTREIPMRNVHHAKMTELLIGRDLSWVK
jgi:DNA adenine methylase